RQDLGAKLGQRKHVHLAGLKIGIEDTAVNSHGSWNQGQVAEDILAIELWQSDAAINETASDGDTVIVVIFQYPHRAGNRINQPRGNSRAEISRRRTDSASWLSGGTVGHVEKEVPFFDCPAVVAAHCDTVDLLDIVLAHVRLNQVAGNGVEIKP